MQSRLVMVVKSNINCQSLKEPWFESTHKCCPACAAFFYFNTQHNGDYYIMSSILSTLIWSSPWSSRGLDIMIIGACLADWLNIILLLYRSTSLKRKKCLVVNHYIAMELACHAHGFQLWTVMEKVSRQIYILAAKWCPSCRWVWASPSVQPKYELIQLSAVKYAVSVQAYLLCH